MPPPRYGFVIFDFDGTLADSGAWFLSIADHLADRFRFRKVEAHEIEELRARTSGEVIRHLGIPRWKLPAIGRHVHALLAQQTDRIALFEGVRPLLHQLAANGVRLALVTSNSKDNARAILGPELSALFERMECGASLFGKAPRYRRVLRKCRIGAADVLSVGDETRDLVAARKAGVASGAVLWGYADRTALVQLQPDHLFDTPEHVLRLVLGDGATLGGQEVRDSVRAPALTGTMSSTDVAVAPDQTFVPQIDPGQTDQGQTDRGPTDRGPTYPFGGAEPATGEVMPVALGIRWVRLHIPGPLRHVNCWLLDDADASGEGVALVDTGMNTTAARDGWKAVWRGALAGVRVTQMIGTHFHPDHIGLAGWMCARHGCPLVMTRGEWLTARMLTADARDAVPDEMIAVWRGAGWDADQIADKSAAGWAGFRTIVTPLPLGYRRIAHDDVLTIGGVAWRVVVGSGHSPEHACLYDAAGKVLIAGDQVLPRISPNVSLGVTEPDADPLGEWFDSIARLRQLPGDVLVLPGHGDPFTGLHARLDAMEREHRERLDMLEALLLEPARAIDCFGALFRRPIGSDMLGLATGEALAHLRRLEVEGRAVRSVEDGVWWYSAV